MSGRRYGSISCTVDVDVSDILEQVDDEDLIAELASRDADGTALGRVENFEDMARDFRQAFAERDTVFFEILLHRLQVKCNALPPVKLGTHKAAQALQ